MTNNGINTRVPCGQEVRGGELGLLEGPRQQQGLGCWDGEMTEQAPGSVPPATIQGANPGADTQPNNSNNKMAAWL